MSYTIRQWENMTEIMNENGERLAEFCTTNNYVI